MRFLFLFFAGFLSGCVSETKTSLPLSFHDYKSCSIIDSDFSLDDVRAIAFLLPRYNYNILIATEGATRTSFGSKIGETILQTFLQYYNGDIFEGKSNSNSIDGLSKTREISESLNGYLPGKMTALHTKKISDADFKMQIDSCQTVSVYILGPYTSFHSYKKIIEEKKSKIYVYGTFPHPKNKNLGWNCEYDLNACYAILPVAKKMDFQFIKFSPKHKYYLTSKEILSLNQGSLQKWIRAVHEIRTDSWDSPSYQMTSDAVALFPFYADKFQKKANQNYPKMNPEDFRSLWLSAFQSTSMN